MDTEFAYSDLHRDEYYDAGLTVLRRVIPASLLTDLRREAQKAREMARALRGPQTQRLQPDHGNLVRAAKPGLVHRMAPRLGLQRTGYGCPRVLSGNP